MPLKQKKPNQTKYAFVRKSVWESAWHCCGKSAYWLQSLKSSSFFFGLIEKGMKEADFPAS